VVIVLSMLLGHSVEHVESVLERILIKVLLSWLIFSWDRELNVVHFSKQSLLVFVKSFLLN
jgi:hypothetical protein